MRETIFLLAIVLALGVNAQESDTEEEAEVEETTGPSWRDGRPTRPNMPGAPAVERPDYEFKMERPTLDLNDDSMGFKPRVAVEEIEDVEDEPVADEAADEVAEEAVAAEVVVEQPAVASAPAQPAPTVETEEPVADDFIAEQSVIENRPAVDADQLIDNPPAVANEPEPAAQQVASASTPDSELEAPTVERAVVTTRARLVPETIVEPEYPIDAWRDNKEGWVDVRLEVNADGSVADARAVRAEPRRIFDRSAVRAAMQWRFEPVDGLGVSETVSRTYRVSFTMDED